MAAQFDPETGSVDVTCDTCGKPITHSNNLGMYCDDECGIDADRAAKDEVMKLLGQQVDTLDQQLDILKNMEDMFK